MALPSGKPFVLTGLWEGLAGPRHLRVAPELHNRTTDANVALNPIHDRMPVIIEPAEYARWLGEEPSQAGELKALLHPYQGELKVWPVSPRMNKPDDAEGPEVIEQVEEAAAYGGR